MTTSRRAAAGPAEQISPQQWELWDAFMRAQRVIAQQTERGLLTNFGISKAEFSVLVSLASTPGSTVRVVDLAADLSWEISRVAHQLTRMENRGLVRRTEAGASGRRTGIGLTPAGRRLARDTVAWHSGNVRRLFFDLVTPADAAAIAAWSERVLAAAEL